MTSKPNRNLSYTEFQAAGGWQPKKDEYGGTIGPRSYDEWKATSNVPADDHTVTINLGKKQTIEAAETGRLKGLFELPRNKQLQYRSEGYLENRKGTESAVMGIPTNAGAARRPIYGHVREDMDFRSGGNDYGDVSLDLWPGKNHITTTSGDSLDDLMDYRDQTYGFGGAKVKLGGINKADAMRATGFGDLGKEHDGSSGWYREAQIHGGVPLDRAHVRRAFVVQSNYDTGDDHIWAAQALRAKGIPTSVVKEHEQPSLFGIDHFSKGVNTEHFYDMTESQREWAPVPKEWEKPGAGPRKQREPLPTLADVDKRAVPTDKKGAKR
jgi:hypothetical protein